MKKLENIEYNCKEIQSKIMGPNPIKLLIELLSNNCIAKNGYVCDLGCGKGVSSVYLANEFGFKVYATDICINPRKNKVFFENMGFSQNEIVPVLADANKLPFKKNFFDGIISIDSYNYFGCNFKYLDNNLLSFLKKGGYVYISVPVTNKNFPGQYSPEVLSVWSQNQLNTIHDIKYWKNLISCCRKAEIVDIYEMKSSEEAWSDWLKQNNKYAKQDCIAIEAGARNYLTFIAIVLRKVND